MIAVWWVAVGFVLGGAVTTWGTWLAFRDNARRYFTIRGYDSEAARREADRVMGVDWYDPRDEQGG